MKNREWRKRNQSHGTFFASICLAIIYGAIRGCGLFQSLTINHK